MDFKEKTKKYLDEKADYAIEKIERVPSRTLAMLTLILISGGVVIFGYFQFQKNLKEPLFAAQVEETKAQMAKKYPVFNLTNILQQNKQTQIDAANADTDSDGLLDILEINTYKTSTYLADSDSDGKTDLEEVTAGTDPNCAEGSTCETEASVEGSQSAQVSAIPSTLNLPEDLDINDPQALLEYEMNAIANDDFESLGITDPEQQAQLKALFEQQYGNFNSDVSADDKANFKDVISQMSTSQMREFLLESGFSQETLDGLTDEELQTAIDKSLESF